MPVAVYSLAAAILGLVFAWSAIAKLLRFSRWRAALEGYGLPGTRALALSVPLVELVVPLLMLAERSLASAALALGLLALFSAAIVRARARRGDRLPCGCFGGAGERDYRLMIARNAGLGLLAAAVIGRGRDLQPLEGFGAPEASDVLPAGLVVVGLLAIGWVFWIVSDSFRRDDR